MRLREYLEIRDGLKSKLREENELDLDFPEITDDEDYDVDEAIEEFFKNASAEDLYNCIESQSLDINDDSIDLEGDLAWQIANECQSRYEDINIRDVLSSTGFKNYLRHKGIKLADVITVTEFVELICEYLAELVKAEPTIGYVICDSIHRYFYCNIATTPVIIFLGMADDPIVDVFDVDQFKFDISNGMYREFPQHPGAGTLVNITAKDTISGLMSKFLNVFNSNDIDD